MGVIFVYDFIGVMEISISNSKIPYLLIPQDMYPRGRDKLDCFVKSEYLRIDNT